MLFDFAPAGKQPCLRFIDYSDRRHVRPGRHLKGLTIVAGSVRSSLIGFAVVLLLLAGGLPMAAHAQLNDFDSEADKLRRIRSMLKKEKSFRLMKASPRQCHAMMRDFLAGKNVRAIEPDARADSEDDPVLAKWAWCRENAHSDMGLGINSFDGWLSSFGGPPYRYYRIELDGNRKNGPEDMIYHQTPPGKENERVYNQTGYTWADLRSCEIKGGFPATSSLSRLSDKPDAVYLNMLLYYRGDLWAADFVEGSYFHLTKWSTGPRKATCWWDCCQPDLPRKPDMGVEVPGETRGRNTRRAACVGNCW